MALSRPRMFKTRGVIHFSFYNVVKLNLEQNITFTVVDRVIALVIVLHETKGLEPRLSIDERPIMLKMINKVCRRWNIVVPFPG